MLSCLLRKDLRGPAQTLCVVFPLGVLTNVLNPKIILLFLVFLQQFFDNTDGVWGWAFLLLRMVFAVNGTLINLGVAWVALRVFARLGPVPALVAWLWLATDLSSCGWRRATEPENL